MTQPSLNQTFDTSLIDLGPQRAIDSFSTSSSTVPSDGGQPSVSIRDPGSSTMQSTMDMSSTLAVSSPSGHSPSNFTNDGGRPTHYLPTATAYDQWASVYDTDGNILQAVDDLKLQSLLPELQRLVLNATSGDGNVQETVRLIDLGCGTARNTCKLLQMQWPSPRVQITGYDVSRGMLDIAQTKLDALYTSLGAPLGLRFHLSQHDFLNEEDVTGPPKFPAAPEEGTRADGLISTLVLEHFPVRPFFQVISGILKVGGVALVTNMHDDMGRVSQAGFQRIDEATGETIKIRGCSWVHSFEEIVSAAKLEGLEVVDLDGTGDREQVVTADMVEQGVVSRRGTKWIGTKVWYGAVFRRVR